MAQTSYPAIIRGNRIEWTGTAPPAPTDELHVSVTIDEPVQQPTPEAKQRMLEAFERLAQRGTFAGVDPVEWQREQRRDRPLPGRE